MKPSYCYLIGNKWIFFNSIGFAGVEEILNQKNELTKKKNVENELIDRNIWRSEKYSANGSRLLSIGSSDWSSTPFMIDFLNQADTTIVMLDQLCSF